MGAVVSADFCCLTVSTPAFTPGSYPYLFDKENVFFVIQNDPKISLHLMVTVKKQAKIF
jgi:hypothetical protein